MYCTLEAPYIVQKVFVVEMLQLFTVALSWAASPSSPSSLVTVLPGALDDHMGVVLPGLLFFLT